MLIETNKNFPGQLPLIPVMAGQSPKQGRTERPKGFDVHQFLWLTEGEGLFYTGGNTVTLTKGQGFFVRCDVPHSYQSNGGEFSTMWVTFKGGEALLDYYKAGDFFFFDAPDFIIGSTMRLIKLWSSSLSHVMLSAHGYLWAVELMDALFKKPVSHPEEVTLFLEHNYDKPLTLDCIAAHSGTDKFSLCRSYSKHTGETVMQTLKKIRIRQAKKFLRYSSFSVEQIGGMCGYESASYFIKGFREQEGCTPLQYRRKKW